MLLSRNRGGRLGGKEGETSNDRNGDLRAKPYTREDEQRCVV